MKSPSMIKYSLEFIFNHYQGHLYDYYLMPEILQLSPVKVGEDNCNVRTENEDRFLIINVVKLKVVLGFFGLLSSVLS